MKETSAEHIKGGEATETVAAEDTRASYTVETGAVVLPVQADTPTASRNAKYAIFITHGMGQPIPFETIDHVAASLRAYDKEEQKNPKPGNETPEPAAGTLKSGDSWLNYIKLQLKSGDDAVEVHLYEGYWAPMTEGAINVRNVMSFLADAGLNGVRHTSGTFRRWLFGEYPVVSIPGRTVFFLLTALATIASLVVMNSTIAIIAAATALLGEKPEWLTDELLADLTTTFKTVVTVMTLFGVSLWLSTIFRKAKARGSALTRWSRVSAVLFYVALMVIIPLGLGIPLLFLAHVGEWAGQVPIWHQTRIPSTFVTAFDKGFDWVVLALVVGVGAAVGFRWLARINAGLEEEFRLQPADKPLTLGVTFLFFLLVIVSLAVGVFFVWMFLKHPPKALIKAEYFVAWPLLVAMSAYIRLILVQYVGDVAIYIMPYKLDAFANLRRAIKQKVYEVARAVYQQDQYDKVIVVGHSLGSVIAYDALNMLILDDTAMKAAQISAKGSDQSAREATKPETTKKPEKAFLNVVERTPLFLTFGCPLDKTAFVFAVQAKGTSEAREALAGSVQPMIVDYKFRPERWINIWSPWDIISGSLELYDYPMKDQQNIPEKTREKFKGAEGKRVVNEVDPEATTLLIAHTEYWKNSLLTKTIYDALDARASTRRQ